MSPVPATILIIGPIPPPYHGVAVSTQSILASPALRGYNLLHLNTSDVRDGQNTGNFDLENVRLAILHVDRCRKLLQAEHPNIVYLPLSQGKWGYLRDALFLYFARRSGCKTVVHLRGSNYRNFYLQSPLWLKWIIQTSLRDASRAVVLGESLRSMMDELIPGERIAVIPNGTSDPLDGMPLPKRLAQAYPQVVFLGNLKVSKGIQVVIRAARQVLDCAGPVRFVFAGEFQSQSEKQETLQLVKELHLEAHVHFLGVVTGSEKDRLLLDSDIQVFPSFYPPEGHPRVIIEGMAAGLPVIGSDHATIPETILDGRTGFIVPKQNVEMLAERLCCLVQDPGLRERMGTAARRRFLECYTAGRANQRLADLFAQVLAE